MSGAAIAATDDPLRDFVSKESFFEGNTVIVRNFDFNLDGIDDYLITSTSRYREAGRRGELDWEVYLSKSQNEYEQAEPVVLPQDGFSVGYLPQLDGKVAITTSSNSNSEMTTIFAYVVEGNKVEIVTLAKDLMLRDSDGIEEHRRIAKDLAVKEIEVATRRYALDELLTPSQLANLGSYEDTYYGKHYFRTDPDHPSRQLVYDNLTNKLVGYDVWGKFTPVENGPVIEPPNSKAEERQKAEEIASRAEAEKAGVRKPDNKTSLISDKRFPAIVFSIFVIFLFVIYKLISRNKK